MSFGIIDYGVFFATLAVSTCIGIYYKFTGGRQTTTNEYLLANQSQSVIPVALSLMASYMSAITILGVSSENYIFGLQFVVINLGYLLFTPVVAYIFLPVFYKMRAASAFKYLQERFGKVAHLVTSLIYMIQIILYMGIALYAPAIVLETLMGISQYVGILIISCVCIFYSTMGGMKAVIITDAFQAIMMFSAVICVIVVEAVNQGSILKIWDIARENGRTDVLNFSVDLRERHTWFSLTIGGGFTFLSLYGVNQTQVQRYLTTRNLKSARMAIWAHFPLLLFLSLTTSFAGLSIYARYHECDPTESGRIKSPDGLMPLYVQEAMSNLYGVSGIFVSGILSASLSTISSCLNSLSAVTVEDYIKPIYRYLKKERVSPRADIVIAKTCTVVYGIVCIGVAIIAQQIQSILQTSLSIFGAVGGPVLGIYTIGICVPFVDEVGAVIGILTGTACSFFLAFGGPKPAPKKLPVSTAGCIYPYNVTMPVPNTDTQEYFFLFEISYLWYIIIGFFVTIFISMLVSALSWFFKKRGTFTTFFKEFEENKSPLTAKDTFKKTCNDEEQAF